MEAAAPGGLGGTYAGNPIAIAASLATLEVIEEEKLADRANQIGDKIKNRLAALAQKYHSIADIRGPGAMVAMELFDAKQQADTELTRNIVKLAAEKGLLLLPCGVYGNVIRFLTPLTIEFEVLDEGLNILEKVMAELS
jgi:4-aminobutyrate aminotransferase